MNALTRELAEAVRHIVIDYYRGYTHDTTGALLPAEDLPRLFEPGHNGPGWDLAWEGGPYMWTVEVAHGRYRDDWTWADPAPFPATVHASPINGCELALYPST